MTQTHKITDHRFDVIVVGAGGAGLLEIRLHGEPDQLLHLLSHRHLRRQRTTGAVAAVPVPKTSRKEPAL